MASAWLNKDFQRGLSRSAKVETAVKSISLAIGFVAVYWMCIYDLYAATVRSGRNVLSLTFKHRFIYHFTHQQISPSRKMRIISRVKIDNLLINSFLSHT